MRIGSTTAPRIGAISFVGFEFGDYDYDYYYTDYLIVDEGDKPFASPGDSGSLIVTTQNFQPIALTWGVGQRRLWTDYASVPFAMAIDMSRILKVLDLELIRDLADLST